MEHEERVTGERTIGYERSARWLAGNLDASRPAGWCARREVRLSLSKVSVAGKFIEGSTFGGAGHSNRSMHCGRRLRPNQSPEPTVMSVTPRADARVAPAT